MSISIKALVEQVVKEEISALGEARPSGVNKKYTHFALDKATNKIINGWEYKDLDKESIAYYVKGDLKDMDVKPADVSILTTQALKKRGIDPFNWDSWKKDGANEAFFGFGKKEGGVSKEDVEKAKSEIDKADMSYFFREPSEGSSHENNKKLVGIIKKNLQDHTPTFLKLFPKVAEDDSVSSAAYNYKGKLLYGVTLGDLKRFLAPTINDVVDDTKSKESWKKAVDELTRGMKEATTTMVTPDGKTLSPEQKAKMKMAKPGTNIVVKKAGELSEDADLQEKKAKEAEEEVPAENPEVPADEAPVEDKTGGSASSELNQHISSAIDSAAKAIEASQDAKYEKVLGKVIKNLTAAQASLADVEAVENKLNEQIAKDEEKSADKFRKNLRKELKGSFKNPEHIDLILKKYDKVAKTASKENRPVQKIAEIITKHALHEGLVKKGDMIA